MAFASLVSSNWSAVPRGYGTALSSSGGPLAISGMPLTLITFYSFPKIRDES
jgi:hypothetical protein